MVSAAHRKKVQSTRLAGCLPPRPSEKKTWKRKVKDGGGTGERKAVLLEETRSSW